MAKPGHIVLGWADKNLAEHGKALGITFHEYETDKELMLLRGPAIIEGLIRTIIENTDTTIHRSRVCIVGQGSMGFLLTRYMVALGAYTHVAARNPAQRAAAQAHGAESHTLEDLPRIAPDIDILVSTVAAPVVPASVIARFPKHALLVDLAAPPGGIDREAAAARGLKFVWARGLGSRAPVTVGRSQWLGSKRRIEEFMEKAG
jgi:dipicolinate synthase subunit A